MNVEETRDYAYEKLSYDRLAQIPLCDMEVSLRLRHTLANYGRYKTLADLELAGDMEILAIPSVGRKQLKEIRDLVRSVRQSQSSLREEMIDWLDKHSSLVLALMKGEAVIMPITLALKEPRNDPTDR